MIEHVWDFAYDGASNVVDPTCATCAQDRPAVRSREQLETVRGAGRPAAGRPVAQRGRARRGHVARLEARAASAAATAVVIAVGRGWLFVWQLQAAQIGALDGGLQVRADALAAQVRQRRACSRVFGRGQPGASSPRPMRNPQVLTPAGRGAALLLGLAGRGRAAGHRRNGLRRAAAGTVALHRPGWRARAVPVAGLPGSKAAACLVILVTGERASVWPTPPSPGRRRSPSWLAVRLVAVAAAGLAAWLLAGAALAPGGPGCAARWPTSPGTTP